MVCAEYLNNFSDQRYGHPNAFVPKQLCRLFVQNSGCLRAYRKIFPMKVELVSKTFLFRIVSSIEWYARNTSIISLTKDMAIRMHSYQNNYADCLFKTVDV